MPKFPQLQKITINPHNTTTSIGGKGSRNPHTRNELEIGAAKEKYGGSYQRTRRTVSVANRKA